MLIHAEPRKNSEMHLNAKFWVVSDQHIFIAVHDSLVDCQLAYSHCRLSLVSTFLRHFQIVRVKCKHYKGNVQVAVLSTRIVQRFPKANIPQSSQKHNPGL